MKVHPDKKGEKKKKRDDLSSINLGAGKTDSSLLLLLRRGQVKKRQDFHKERKGGNHTAPEPKGGGKEVLL